MSPAQNTPQRRKPTQTRDPLKVDTVIVGAGSAGLSALREVRRYTEDFLLVNDGHWGTTCAAAGCMPSKALIEAANAFHMRGSFAEFGIQGAEGLRADIPAVLARVDRISLIARRLGMMRSIKV